MNTRDLTLQFLQSLQEQGVHKLPLNEEARLVLREWMLAARAAKKQAITPPAAADHSAIPPASAAARQAYAEASSASLVDPSTLSAPSAPAHQPTEPQPRAQTQQNISPAASADLAAQTPAAPAAPLAAAQAPSIAAPAEELGAVSGLILPEGEPQREPAFPPEVLEASFHVPQGELAERWQAFAYLLHHWNPVKKLATLRDQLVLGQGSKHADIMFIGDAPNAADEQSGRPFSGEAGKKLDEILKAMSLSRDEIYLTHLIKYRPKMPRQMTNNRPPSAIEVELFAHVLRSEIELVAPRVIVALGVIAARGLLQLGDLPLAAYQADSHSYEGIPVLVSHHPSYLLRTVDRAERRALWEVMLRSMEIAQLPISAKQQGFFLPKRG